MDGVQHLDLGRRCAAAVARLWVDFPVPARAAARPRADQGFTATPSAFTAYQKPPNWSRFSPVATPGLVSPIQV